MNACPLQTQAVRNRLRRDNVRVIPDAGDVEIVGADKIAKLSAETSEGRPVAAWDQRIVIPRFSIFCLLSRFEETAVRNWSYPAVAPFEFAEPAASGITTPRVTRPIASIEDVIKPISTSNGEFANRAIANKQARKTPAAARYAADWKSRKTFAFEQTFQLSSACRRFIVFSPVKNEATNVGSQLYQCRLTSQNADDCLGELLVVG